MSTTHAEHFLTRIDRLNTCQAEMALALYRDEELIAYVLNLADLPKGTSRVALSLSEGDKGPFVIVTRGGRFVTCLGEGMKLHDDQVLIGHHKLEQLSRQVERLRTMFAEARAGKRQRCDQLLVRIALAGNNITQAEFDDMLVLNPFVGHLQLTALLRALGVVEEIEREVQRAKRFGKHLDPLLREYWRFVWETVHLTMLMGEDHRFAQRVFDLVDRREPDGALLIRSLFIMPPYSSGLMPFALRGAWFAAQMPKAYLKLLKAGFTKGENVAEAKVYGLGLAAIGHRHQKYRSEVVKFFQSARSQWGETALGATAAALSKPFERPADFGAARLEAECDAVLRNNAKLHVPSHTSKTHLEGLPLVTKLALSLNLPISFWRAPDDVARMYDWLPTVARLQARDFYLPERERHRLVKQEYDYRTGLAFISGRFDIPTPEPVRVAMTPGRNEPCACGSGKKFKRCCGAVSVDLLCAEPRRELVMRW